jgi:predicted phosphodiesterase
MKMFTEKYKEVIMLEGNHDKNTIKYILSLGVKVVPNIVIDNNYYGHFFVEKSIKSFNSAKRSLDEFNDYNYVFLGHQHTFQILGNKRVHPGSCIFVDFGEVDDTSKNIIMLENNNMEIIELKSPIPMIDVFKREDLDKLDKNYKVRYVIKTFNQLKQETNDLDQYKEKFYQFKIKLDFDTKGETLEIAPKKNTNEIIENWLNNIEDQDVKKELELSFREDK